jgi:hypothetical protein
LSNRRGGLLRKPYEDEASALAEMNRINVRRLRRGYQRLTGE